MTTHTVVATIGSYGVTWFFIQFLGRALNNWGGMSRSESVLTATMSGFLIFLILIISAFAIRSIFRLIGVISALVLSIYLANYAVLAAGI